MLAGKNSKHIKNRYLLITDKVAHRGLEIRHMGTKSMWADVNTNPVQGALFRILRSDMMGMPVEYGDDVERRRTHPLLLTLIDTEIVSLPDGDILEKIVVVVPVNKVSKLGPITGRDTYRVISISRFLQEQSRWRNEGVCWEIPSMDRVPNPIGKRVVPVI